MQYLKDEVRNRIVAAALQEFSEKGYMDASMRRIAAKAEVALGNLYRYFKNKEELFNELIEPFYNLLMGKRDKDVHKTGCTLYAIDSLERITDEFLKFIGVYHTQLLILIDKSRGTKFEGTKDIIVRHAEHELRDALLPELITRGIKVNDDYIFHIMASTFIEGVFGILRKYQDKQQIQYLARQLMYIYFYDITNRFEKV